jgi:hypothetical protein
LEGQRPRRRGETETERSSTKSFRDTFAPAAERRSAFPIVEKVE